MLAALARGVTDQSEPDASGSPGALPGGLRGEAVGVRGGRILHCALLSPPGCQRSGRTACAGNCGGEAPGALAVIAGGPADGSATVLFRLWGSLVRHHPPAT